MLAAQKELAGRVRFVGVVSGPDSAVDEYALQRVVDEMGLDYPQIRDRDLALTHLFGVSSTPTVVVLGADGSVLYQGHGLPDSWSEIL